MSEAILTGASSKRLIPWPLNVVFSDNHQLTVVSLDDTAHAAPVLAAQAGRAAEPVRLIFDTDICGDCDDVLALGMIHSLQSRGLCRLLAVTISVDHELAAPFVDAVNTFYERGDIPIGVVGKGGVIEKSEFLSLVEEQDSGRFRYPHDLVSNQAATRRNGPPPRNPGGPARSLRRDRSGRFLDQPGPAARVARG